jgi:hypothetical protein
LLAFKQSLSSSDEAKLASWTPGSNHCSDWAGVQCLQGVGTTKRQQVYLLDLSEQGMQFHLRSLDFAALPALQVLWLQENFISGSLDALAQPGQLPALSELRAHSTGVSGTIPASLPPRLRKLYLQGNALSGMLPAGLSTAAPDLEVVLLSSNNLTGVVERQGQPSPVVRVCSRADTGWVWCRCVASSAEAE